MKKSKIMSFFNLVNRHIRRLRCLPVLPRTFCLAVTYKCNGKCVMCDLWKVYRENPKLVKEELSLSEIQDFLSDREFFKDLDFVYLSGGEPFLREDLPEIVKSIHECNPTCIVYVATNGFLTDRIVKTTKEILSIHPKFQIGVSLDGINEIHDKIRGVKGAFKKASETLFALRENFPNLHIQVTMTVTPINFRHVPHVYDFCKKNVFFPRIGLASVSEYFKNLPAHFEYSKEEIEDLKKYFHAIGKDIIQERGKINSLMELFWLDGSIKFLMDPTTRLVPCYAGFVSFYIDPYGTVYPCYNFLKRWEIYGNKRYETFGFLKHPKQSENVF